ncbi:hypothetical protein [Neobacillus jeddahensis]|uniref:hypothetical protein n=1 Tax=Neobacillus jeddahensis TaxID=1461580 RepID=UPI0005906999|nr:hypothetical protein [Neobacillus jeddahensis]
MPKKLLLFIMLFIVLSGCQNDTNRSSDEEAYDLRNDTTAPNYMSNRNNDRNTAENMTNRGKTKQHQVENDITNQNPNFLDLGGTGSGSEAGANNQGNDINKAKQVVAATKEFETDSVVINGDRMWVSVYKKGILSDQVKIDAEARLHRKLVQALPSYHMEVSVKEDRR